MKSPPTIADQTIVVILAAGKGTRMGRGDLGKVCFEIDSVPAINRLIGVFKKKLFNKFLLVVGAEAEQVLNTVAGAHSGVMCIYQEPQLGTGHAAKVAAEALENMGYAGNVLVTAGDKFIEEEAIEALLSGYVRHQADFALLTVPRSKATERSVGRVVVDRAGQAVDIVERVDRARQAIVDELKDQLAEKKTGRSLAASDVLRVIEKHLPYPDKQTVAVAGLLELAQGAGRVPRARLEKLLDSRQYNLEIEGKALSARQIERIAKGANPSLYLFRAEVFYEGVGLIQNNNAQREYYLTDVVKILAGIRDSGGKRKYRIRAVPAQSANWIQGFNSPDELLAIQDYVRRKKLKDQEAPAKPARPQLPGSQYATVRRWLDKIAARKAGLRRWLRSVYGPYEELHDRKCKALTRALQCYGKRFGFDQKVCIVRAPGRINLMGRHVDHRGGLTNFLAIDRETIAVAGLRRTGDVAAVNTEPGRFGPVEFSIPQLIGRFAWSDWWNFVNSDWVRSMLQGAPGDWGNYIKAALVRLQHRYQDVKIRGLNLAICGNVPIAAGLGSSSTLMVATLQAAIALNNFEITSRQFVGLCSEGEWFLGSRGGAGDPAAIYLGQRGKVAHVGYLPFRVEKLIDAPEDYQVLIADSHVQTAGGAAKDVLNARITSYNLGLALLKQRCPEIASAVEHLRDVDPSRLGCPTSDVYRMLLKVPQFARRADFTRMLAAEHRPMMEADFATHPEPESYNPRGVLLYGIAEIMRSRMCADLLQTGQVEQLGALMRISHDGDRVARPDRDGTYRPLEEPCTDEYLHRLIADLSSEDPQRVLHAQLTMQPGSYASSTPEIDRMVDVASGVPGVAGAQIAGAGLGGCIMILAGKGRLEAVRKALVRDYYRPRRLKPAVLPCVTVEGAGLVGF